MKSKNKYFHRKDAKTQRGREFLDVLMVKMSTATKNN